jgi:hypothetical protein
MRYDDGHGPQMAVHLFQQRPPECPWFPLAREPEAHQGGAMNAERSKPNVQAGIKLTNSPVGGEEALIQEEENHELIYSTCLCTLCEVELSVLREAH